MSTGLQGFLLGPFIWPRDGQLFLSALATEEGPTSVEPGHYKGHHHYSTLLKALAKMSFITQISCSTQTLVGASSTIQFFLSEAFLGQHFKAVELESEPEPGDLFLFRLQSPTGRWCGAHVGVYCGQGEIIHFEGRTPGSWGPHRFLGPWEGIICKQGQRPLRRTRSLWRVLRHRHGVDRALLETRVREAMETDPPPYHPTQNNCVHFALHLLGLDRSPNSVSVSLDLTTDKV